VTTFGLSWLLTLTVALSSPVALAGDATYYAAPYIGRPMRNGEPYDPQAMTCAVSAALWVLSPDDLGCVGDALFANRMCFANRRLLVCSNANCCVVTVTDTGDADAFARHGVVVDLSGGAYRALFGRLDGKQQVRAWVLR